jgi:CBS domain containing-hemolysin-like protein
VNAFYVSAEFASVSVRRSRIQQLAEGGSGPARCLLPVLEDPHLLERYIAACQVGITLSSLILGAYGEERFGGALAGLLHELFGLELRTAESTAALVVLIGLTALSMVLGELVPKSIALRFPTQAALYTVMPMQWSLTLFSPFIAVLNGSGLLLLRTLGAPQGGHRHIHSPEEIELLIAESRDGGVLEPDEHRRLRRALQLGVRTVRQIMVPRVHVSGIEIDTPMVEVLAKLAISPYTRLPVYRETIDHVVGMLHTKDLVVAYVQRGTLPSIEQVIRPVLQVPDGLTADRLLSLLREQRCHQAIVLDEFGGVVGLVTLEDVLAEVLGHVGDEFKRGEVPPERLADGRVRLPGQMRLDVAEPWLGILWEGEAETVGGRVIEALGTLPVTGDRVAIDGVQVEVERVENRAVVSILARPLHEPGEAPDEV